MSPKVPADIEPLLRDNAWFARITRALVSGGEEDIDLPTRPVHPSSGVGLNDAVALVEMRGEVLNAVLALHEPWRATVTLQFLEGWPIAKVAQLTCAPEVIVRRRVRRGLQWMRAKLRSTSSDASVSRP